MLYRLGLSGTHTAGLELMALLISAPKQWDGGWGTTIPGLSLALLKDAVILNQCFVFNQGEKHYFELLKCTVLVKSSRNIGKKRLAHCSSHRKSPWRGPMEVGCSAGLCRESSNLTPPGGLCRHMVLLRFCQVRRGNWAFLPCLRA